jgi:2-dehydro-3-deoxy-D-arabinonate dehydratase
VAVEGGGVDYDKVYDAKRPELFMKALPGRVRGPGEPIGIRADSTWDVPEPELAAVADASGRLVAYSVGNDVSSRSIEGENPLYLPQAKVYRGSAALGPCLVPVAEAPPFETLSVTLEISRDDNAIFQESVSLVTMRRRPDELLSWLFLAEDFPVGVALLTGTSIVPGPELTLRPKDRVAISISGVGTVPYFLGIGVHHARGDHLIPRTFSAVVFPLSGQVLSSESLDRQQISTAVSLSG